MFRRDKWWVREIERIQRAHQAREAELVETICRLSGHPTVQPLKPRGETEPRTWTPSPEQLPVN